MTDAIIISPAAAGVRGEITLPGDKSISHRAVMFAAIARGTSHIQNCSLGGDNRSTINAFRTLGVKIDQTNTDVVVHGRGWNGLREPTTTIDCGNSGTSMRLLAGLLAGRPFASRLDGDVSLRSRPMGRVITPLRAMGADISSEGQENCAPLRIRGRTLHGINYRNTVASAQVKSALLLAGLQAQGQTQVWEPVRSRDHTERMFPAFGVRLSIEETEVSIEGGQELHACDVEVPGDLSSAAFFLGAALVVADSELLIRNVGLNPTRTGVLDVLRAMGARIIAMNQREVCGESVGDLLVQTSLLHGIEIGGELVVRTIDELPLVAAVAPFAQGQTVIRGAQELRVKESDRIQALATTLSALGARVNELPDGLIIDGNTGLQSGTVESFGDHRMAMAMTVAGLASQGEVVLRGASCASISFPNFYDLVQNVTGATTIRLCGE